MVILIFLVIFIFIITLAYLYTESPRHKLAIVSLIKEPNGFATWINYHKKTMGVNKFYVFLDNSSEDLKFEDPDLVIVRDWKERLGYLDDPNIDEPANRNRKQDMAVSEGMKMAENDDIRYIVHIDSDELLYGPETASEVFSRYKADVFHMKNAEMAPDRKDYKNCFMEGTWFHGDPIKFIAYGNGKSGGVVGKTSPYGPHYFAGDVLVDIPEHELKVLHYPSCNIEETIKRAKNYGNFSNVSAGWSEHHKETRDVLANCDSDCKEKAEQQFEKRMAGPDAYQIDVKFPDNY